MAIRKCKECGKDVSSKAKKCPHCGAPPLWRVSSGRGYWSIVLCTVVGLVIYLKADYDNMKVRPVNAGQGYIPSAEYQGNSLTGAFMHGFNEGLRNDAPSGPGVDSYNEALASLPGSHQSGAPEVVEHASPPLELQSFRCEKLRAYMHVRGEVKNVSTSKLDNVLIVATFRAKGGELVTSQHMPIEYSPFMPGQTSPFHVMAEDSPEISRCEIGFRLFSGESLQYAEKKKGK